MVPSGSEGEDEMARSPVDIEDDDMKIVVIGGTASAHPPIGPTRFEDWLRLSMPRGDHQTGHAATDLGRRRPGGFP
jgi:hypothetical protein